MPAGKANRSGGSPRLIGDPLSALPGRTCGFDVRVRLLLGLRIGAAEASAYAIDGKTLRPSWKTLGLDRQSGTRLTVGRTTMEITSPVTFAGRLRYSKGGIGVPVYHEVEQRSAAWFAARIGRPTASEFYRILTPTGKLSAQCTDYAHRILAEMMLGKPLDSPETEYMTRGVDLEDSALEAYEFQTGLETSPGGFVTDDAGTIGCSPDRLVGDDGVLELKVPAPNTHVGYLLDRNSLNSAKWPQVQGQLLVTGRQWVDLVAYHPEMPLVVVRVKRDEPYIEKMRAALADFVQQLALMREKLEREYGPFKPITFDKPAALADDALGVSEDDVTAIWEASQI